MPRILSPIRISLARQFPDFSQAEVFHIRIVGDDEVAQWTHGFRGSCYGGFFFGRAVGEVEAANYAPGFCVGVGREGDDGKAWVGGEFGEES